MIPTRPFGSTGHNSTVTLFGGAAFMVFFKQDISGTGNLFAGNVLFFFNCLGTALYVIWCVGCATCTCSTSESSPHSTVVCQRKLQHICSSSSSCHFLRI